MIAALFVARGGAYFGVSGVDPWDESRDARRYPGPHPVVAHPPCSRWCRLAGLVEARWGHKRGEDEGCFASALESLRRYGGVLEHPAYSDAWRAFDLPRPPTGHKGWITHDGAMFSCYVEQRRYGHQAKKATWLLVCRPSHMGQIRLPELEWGHSPDNAGGPPVSWCGNKVKLDGKRRRLTKKEASATPPAFRDVLIAIARGFNGPGVSAT